jgi:hypothetical protein
LSLIPPLFPPIGPLRAPSLVTIAIPLNCFFFLQLRVARLIAECENTYTPTRPCFPLPSFFPSGKFSPQDNCKAQKKVDIGNPSGVRSTQRRERAPDPSEVP